MPTTTPTTNLQQLRALARQLGADYARSHPGIRDDGSTDDYGVEVFDALSDAVPNEAVRPLYRELLACAPELADWEQWYSFDSVRDAQASAVMEVLELEAMDAARTVANPEDLAAERGKRQANMPIAWGVLRERLEAAPPAAAKRRPARRAAPTGEALRSPSAA